MILHSYSVSNRVTRFLLCHSRTVSGHFHRTSPNASLPLDIPPGKFPRTFPTRVTRFLLCHSRTVSGHFHRTSPNASLPLDIPPGKFPRTFPTKVTRFLLCHFGTVSQRLPSLWTFLKDISHPSLISNALLKLIICFLVKF